MITVNDALVLAQKALTAAASQDVNIAVAIVDPGGHAIASARMERAGYLSAAAALKKAQTSVSLGFPTQTIATMAGKDATMLAALSGQGDYLLLAGGIPIKDGDDIIGAIGVAGGHYLQDQAIAEFAMSS